MRLGVCYYPEHWPESRWPIDARLMREAGLDIVRIAEFAWSRMEPAKKEYEWAWLDRAIAILGDAGLDVVLGTPTATPPRWLTHAYPEVLRVDANGRRRDHGSRRHYCPNSEKYHQLSRAIVTAMAERYGQHPHVIGWQIDNEWGGGYTARCYCQNCATAFHWWLRSRYGDIATLNDSWGASFWSQAYTSWEQIALPSGAIDKPNPSQLLDFYRFSSDSYVAYQQVQLDVLSQLAPEQFTTTNFMGLYRELDQFDLARAIDFASWDSYPTGNPDRWREQLYAPAEAAAAETTYAYDVGDPLLTGLAHNLTRALKDKPFWIMEQQAGAINWGKINSGIRPGTTRLWTWHALAEGAETVVYFRWRSTLFAQEQYHSGLLRHDGSTAVGLTDLETMRREKRQMADLTQLPHKAEVGLLFDFKDLWAIDIQPHRAGFDYLRHLFLFYRACHRLGIEVDVVPYEASFTDYPLLIAPTLHIAQEPLAARLATYVRGGGSLLLGVRSGFKTESNLVTSQPLPGVLRPLTGSRVVDWQALPAGVGWDLETDVPDLAGAAGTWVEALQPERDDVEVRATYTEGPYAQMAALTRHRLDTGTVHQLGWYPDLAQAAAILMDLADRVNIARGPEGEPGLVSRRRGDRAILLNFTERPLTATVGGRLVTVDARDVVVV